jgi:hypothetical protein
MKEILVLKREEHNLSQDLHDCVAILRRAGIWADIEGTQLVFGPSSPMRPMRLRRCRPETQFNVFGSIGVKPRQSQSCC